MCLREKKIFLIIFDQFNLVLLDNSKNTKSFKAHTTKKKMKNTRENSFVWSNYSNKINISKC